MCAAMGVWVGIGVRSPALHDCMVGCGRLRWVRRTGRRRGLLAAPKRGPGALQIGIQLDMTCNRCAVQGEPPVCRISMQDGSLFAADGAQAEEGTQQDLTLPLLVSPDDTLRPIAKRQCPACRGAHRAHTCQRRTASQEVSRVVEPYVGHHLCFAPSHGAYSLRPPARVQLSSKQLSSKLHLS